MMDVWEGNQSIRIVNFYNPCKKLSKEEMENIRGNINQKVIWCGDFNAIILYGGVRKRILMD